MVFENVENKDGERQRSRRTRGKGRITQQVINQGEIDAHREPFFIYEIENGIRVASVTVDWIRAEIPTFRYFLTISVEPFDPSENLLRGRRHF